MARRGLWMIGGVAAGVGALALVPGANLWLRRRLGLEAEDRRWFEDETGDEHAEHEGDEPLDTREARYSLRARLSEDGQVAAVESEPDEPGEMSQNPEQVSGLFAATAPPVAPEPPAPAFTWPAPEPAVHEPARVHEAAPDPAPEPEPEPAAPEPAPAAYEPAPAAAVPEAAPAEPEPEPAVEEPEPAAEQPEFVTHYPMPASPDPAPAPEYLSYESVPAVTPEADEPKTPGEDTNEIPPLPPAGAWSPPAALPPLPPPADLRPAPEPPSRPFSRPFGGEGASFRSAIDAARERVHEAAREATPEESENGEPRDESS
jgi:hypothetical protein